MPTATVIVIIIGILLYFGTFYYVYRQEKMKNDYKKSFIYFYLFDSTVGFQALFMNWLMLIIQILCIVRIIIKFIQIIKGV